MGQVARHEYCIVYVAIDVINHRGQMHRNVLVRSPQGGYHWVVFDRKGIQSQELRDKLAKNAMLYSGLHMGDLVECEVVDTSICKDDENETVIRTFPAYSVKRNLTSDLMEETDPEKRRQLKAEHDQILAEVEKQFAKQLKKTTMTIRYGLVCNRITTTDELSGQETVTIGVKNPEDGYLFPHFVRPHEGKEPEESKVYTSCQPYDLVVYGITYCPGSKKTDTKSLLVPQGCSLLCNTTEGLRQAQNSGVDSEQLRELRAEHDRIKAGLGKQLSEKTVFSTLM